jgi:serine/threonine-protein phosphatase 2A regulatory subunit A
LLAAACCTSPLVAGLSSSAPPPLHSSVTMPEGQNAFVVFRRALMEEPIEVQVAATKKLPTVILAAGSDVTKESMFPLLKEYIAGSGDDEVLLAIAASLDLKEAAADCTEVLGTTPARNCFAEILEILEALCAIEETVVRDQAVVSINHTLDLMTNAAASAVTLPILDRLSKNEWFTARVSASALLPDALRKSDGTETTTAIVQTFVKFCEDETPMVRRAVARVFASFAETVSNISDGTGADILTKDVLPQFKQLSMEDDSASVQHIIAENASRLVAMLARPALIEYVRWCAESPSWRIRSIVASQFGAFCKVLADTAAAAEALLPLFLGLLVDPERDVRAEACRGAVALHTGVGHVAFVGGVVPKLLRCIADESHVVRNAYAESCSDIILALGEGDRSASSGGAGVNELLVKTFALLSDDNSEVRAKVMSAIHRLTERSASSKHHPQNENGIAGGGGMLLEEERFLSSLQNVARDRDWRVRASFTAQLPALAKALGQAQFQQHFFDAYSTLINDEVAAVRIATVSVATALADELEESWLHKVLLPLLLERVGPSGSPNRKADRCA